MKSSVTRRIILALTALVFAAVAVGSLLAPHEMAEGLGYTLASSDALNEFRAIYVGLWLATASIFALASRRVENALLGDLCALLLIGQVAGRMASLVLDGPPSERIWPMFAAEGSAVSRCSRSGPPDAVMACCARRIGCRGRPARARARRPRGAGPRPGTRSRRRRRAARPSGR